MKKNILKSKTFWGALVFAIITFLTQAGYVEESIATQLLQLVSGMFGIYGLRKAIR